MKVMKKKKKSAFTLIELLAVIVILAIIALIATPLVLKYIEKAKNESKVNSTHAYVRSLEMRLANYSLENGGKKYPSTGDAIALKDLDFDVEVNGESPNDGLVCLSNGRQVTKGVFKYEDGKYYVIYDGLNASIVEKSVYDSFSCSDDVVYPESSGITWDGNIEGRIGLDLGDGVGYYLISDYIPTAEELKNVNVVLSTGEKTVDVPTEIGDIYMSSYDDTPTEQVAYIVVLNDNAELDGIAFPKAGIYSIRVDSAGEELFYVNSISFAK